MINTLEVPKSDLDLEKLGLINQGLFTVDGVPAERYRAVLKSVFGLDCDVDSFRIDKRGLSPELSRYYKEKYTEKFEYGESYLGIQDANRFMIVVSPDQKDAPLYAPQTSFDDDLLDSVHKQARHTIEDITQYEALFGELDDGVEVYRAPDDLLRLRTVEVSLDTLNKTMATVSQLKRMSKHLGDKDNASDPEYIVRMQELVKRVGIGNRMVSDIFPIKKEVHCFYVEFFNGIHCLRNFRNEDDIRTLFVYGDRNYLTRDFGPEILVMKYDDRDLLERLHRYDFARYNPELVEQRIREAEDEIFLREGVDLVDISPPERKRLVNKYIPQFPRSWNELSDIANILENLDTDIEDLVENKTFETRLKLSEGKRKKEIVDNLLAELDPTDPVRIYTCNVRKLVREFPSMPLNKQRYIAHKLLEYRAGGN